MGKSSAAKKGKKKKRIAYNAMQILKLLRKRDWSMEKLAIKFGVEKNQIAYWVKELTDRNHDIKTYNKESEGEWLSFADPGLTPAQEEVTLREESMAAKRHEQLFGDLKKIPKVNIPKTDGQTPFPILVKNPDKPSVLLINSPLVGTLASKPGEMDIFKNSIRLAEHKKVDAIVITGNLLYCLVEKYGKQRPYHTQVVGVEPDTDLLEDSYPAAVLKEIGPLTERIDKNKLVFMTIKVYLDSLFKEIKKKFLNDKGKAIFKGNVYVVLGEMEEEIAMYYANEALRTEVFREKSFANKKIRELRTSLRLAKKVHDVDEIAILEEKINGWLAYERLLVLMGNVTPSIINERRQQMINYLAYCIESSIPNAKVIGEGDVYLKVGKQLVSVTNDKVVDSVRGGQAGRIRKRTYNFAKGHSGERVPYAILGSGMNPWGTTLYASYRIKSKKDTLDDVRMSDATHLMPCIDSNLYRETVRRMLKAKGKVVKLASTSNFESGVSIMRFFEPGPFPKWDWYKSDFLVNEDVFGSDKLLTAYADDPRAQNVFMYKEGCTHLGAIHVATYDSLDDKQGRYIKYHNQVIFEAFQKINAPIHLYAVDGDILQWMNFPTFKERDIKQLDPEELNKEFTAIENNSNLTQLDKAKRIKLLSMRNSILKGIIQPQDQIDEWGRTFSHNADFFIGVIERAKKAGIQTKGLLGILTIGQGNHCENTFKRSDFTFSEARMIKKEIELFLLRNGYVNKDLEKYLMAGQIGGIGITHGIFSVTSLGDKAYEYCVFMKHKSGRSSKSEDNMKGMITSFSERGSTDDWEDNRFTLNLGGDDHLGGNAMTRNAVHLKTGGQMFSGPFGFMHDFPKQNLFSAVCSVAAGGPNWGPFSVMRLGFRPVRKLAAYKVDMPKELFENPV